LALKYITEIDIKEKRLLIRVDLNVSLDGDGNILDDTRVRSILPTVNYALDEDARIILASHMGRPGGKVRKELSLAPVAKRLQRLLKKEVIMAEDCIGLKVAELVKKMQPGDIVLLENLRFHKEEEENDEKFGRELAELCDVYINDAFATAHRFHASNVAVVKFVKECAAGLLMKNELNYFKKVLEEPVRPLVAIIGGAKVSSKLEAIENLIGKVDKMIIGGAMANTFLAGLDCNVGKSKIEPDFLGVAKRIVRSIRKKKVKLYLPIDCVVGDRFDPKAETMVVPIQEIPANWLVLDIGPATVTLYGEILQNAKTIIWNGPMGAFEMDPFSRGTYAMVHHVANAYALTIVGGGDTDIAIHRTGELSKFSYISTGGGAFLEFLEGKKLPAIKALEDKSGKKQAE
jgi:phosphoglycerate kinase